MACCALCESYMTDVLDSPPEDQPSRKHEFAIRLRPGLPLMVATLRSILKDLGAESVQIFGQMDAPEIFGVCMQYPFFIELLEDTLDEMARQHGLLTKYFRNWLLNKYITILATIHEVHLEHTMLPKQHKQKKELGKPIPVICSGLRIQIPKFDENDIYS